MLHDDRSRIQFFGTHSCNFPVSLEACNQRLCVVLEQIRHVARRERLTTQRDGHRQRSIPPA